MENLIWAQFSEADEKAERNLYRILTEKGLQKSFREIKAYDRIEDSRDDPWNTAEAKAARDKEPWYYILPFIREGVVKEGAGEIASIWLYFRVEDVDQNTHSMNISIELYAFERERKIFFCVGKFMVSCHAAQTVGDCRFSIMNSETGKHLLQVLSEANDREHFLSMEEKKILDHQISAWNEEKIRQSYIESANLFLQLIEHLNILMANAPVAEQNSPIVPQKEKTKSEQRQSAKLDKKEKKPEIVYLGSVRVVQATQNSQLKIKKKRIINRYTETWGIRGHLRHYKSGKIVVVRPYEKGPGRQKSQKPERKQKIYRAKEASV